MSKKVAEHINDALPIIFTNIGKILNSNEFGKIVSGATGTLSIIVKLLGQPVIDNCFEKLTKKKLDNHGLNTYVKAGFIQANESLAVIDKDLKQELAPESILNFLNETLKLEINKLATEDILLIFRPIYHPAIISIKRHYEKVLIDLQTPEPAIEKFTQHFNEHIAVNIKEAFGNDYDEHIENTTALQREDSEANFLLDMVDLDKIGFKESENLKYEETYAHWKKVSEFNLGDHDELNGIDKQEEGLVPIQDLISEYFEQSSDYCLESILFILADFGKGKSVFLRQYAVQKAKEYIEKKEGFFPVYFNLRDYRKYSGDDSLGVISAYLQTRYSIEIENPHFKKHKYIFLIDSLDESGDLNKISIDKVIASVKKIQYLSMTECRDNRIIISSRPLGEGLDSHLNEHKPFVRKNKENRSINYFISIYGFKKEQFNQWLIDTLKNHLRNNTIEASGFAKEVIENINNDLETDIYQILETNKTLSTSELRRPIFAYMIYQLIINNIDFSAIGKIGVFLSFLNLLTKYAKHMHDPSYVVNLSQEFEYRNLLHVISTLWMFQRHKGSHGGLNKANICRALEGTKTSETDAEILGRFKDKGVIEIQFLSHSYFGEKDKELHFQHQSFAEILLAEYYLKVFIKYALDKKTDVDKARSCLFLGEPTAQTIQFLTEMLMLLKDSTMEQESNDSSIIQKRRLLFPLMASLATEKNNLLFCDQIYYKWFELYPCEENQVEYREEALINWCITPTHIKRMIDLCNLIIESKTHYTLQQAESRTALYDNELLMTESVLGEPLPDIDRWLALLAGNILCNQIPHKVFFNQSMKDTNVLFDMIKRWNFSFNKPAPVWANSLFIGTSVRGEYSNSHLQNLNISRLHFPYSTFNNVIFDNVDITNVDIRNTVGVTFRTLAPAFITRCSFSSVTLATVQKLNSTERDTYKVYSKLGGHMYGTEAGTTSINLVNVEYLAIEVLCVYLATTRYNPEVALQINRGRRSIWAEIKRIYVGKAINIGERSKYGKKTRDKRKHEMSLTNASINTGAEIAKQFNNLFSNIFDDANYTIKQLTDWVEN